MNADEQKSEAMGTTGEILFKDIASAATRTADWLNKNAATATPTEAFDRFAKELMVAVDAAATSGSTSYVGTEGGQFATDEARENEERERLAEACLPAAVKQLRAMPAYVANACRILREPPGSTVAADCLELIAAGPAKKVIALFLKGQPLDAAPAVALVHELLKDGAPSLRWWTPALRRLLADPAWLAEVNR